MNTQQKINELVNQVRKAQMTLDGKITLDQFVDMKEKHDVLGEYGYLSSVSDLLADLGRR